MHDYNFNYYLSGTYHDGGKYHEKEASEDSCNAALDEIKEAEITFIKMGSPKNLACGVVKLVGLQIIKEVDSTYER